MIGLNTLAREATWRSEAERRQQCYTRTGLIHGLLLRNQSSGACDGWRVLGDALITAGSATVIYIVGCLAVNVVFNVPLNNRLDAVDPTSAEGHTRWAHYLYRWVRWNHVRSVATLVSTLLMAMTLINLE